jgi:DNA repair protein RecO (recombination protein O)
MATAQRIADDPAYVLHHYDWSESSLILEVFSRRSGRMALVAKGAKKPSSSFRPVLLPLQPLRLSYGGDADIRTLKGVEWVGGHVMPTGEALWSGYYLNELLLKLLARDDPSPRLFDHYASAVRLLATGEPALMPALLRVFELLLLRELGWLPALDAQTLTFAPLEPGQWYALVPEAGLRQAQTDDKACLQADQWMALQQSLDQDEPFVPTLRVLADMLAPLRVMLRQILNYHGGVANFRTRQMMIELQNL